MTKTKTTTEERYQYRVMVKFRWSSRYVQMKDRWTDTPRYFSTLSAAKAYVQRCLDPEGGVYYGYRTWPFGGAEFRTEGRHVVTTVETGEWMRPTKLGHSPLAESVLAEVAAEESQ